jgi:quinol monooxygenase YgiN
MIRLTGHLLCASAKDLAIVQANVGEHIRLTHQEPGCLSFEVVQTEDPMVWEVRETFRTRADFDAHQIRTRASEWFAQSKDIPRAFRVEEIAD